MKTQKHIKKYLLITVLLVVVSCNDFLEENPDNRVELNTLDKAAQLLTNAYSGASYSFTEWMSDNVSYTFGTQKLVQHDQAYKWEDITDINQDTPSNFWTTTYDAIAHANEVLAVIETLPGDEARRNAVKGEALLCRAYGHFMLVNLFAKHYDDQTADDDLGIPYIKEPETEFIKKYKRNTVEEVYDFIEDDLEDGLELINDSFYANSGKYHFTRGAALAFASRFYLFKRQYSKCIEYSTELLGANPETYVKDIPSLLLQKINTEDYIRLYHSPTDNSNLLLVRQVSNFHVPSLGHWPTRPLYSAIFEQNPFGLTDERQDPAWVAGENGLSATKFEFLFERSSLTSNVGFNYTIFLGFRGEEVLLNRAEANILSNRLAPALADLQLLASKRYRGSAQVTAERLRNYYGSTNDRLVTLLYILDERTKEFMHEGLRWFDIKRYGFEVSHVLPDGSTIRLDEEDDRKILQIPQPAIDIGGLEPNPR
jgi:starch-binding outer membrane protein, SusD/RagB family